MEEPNRLILAPNGSGALFDAINFHQEVRDTINSVEYVQVLNVDNVLAKVLDPFHIGFTSKYDLYLGIKASNKRNEDTCGILAKKNKRYYIVDAASVAKASDGED